MWVASTRTSGNAGKNEWAPGRTYRRGLLRLNASELTLTNDIRPDVAAVIARSLRRCGAEVLLLKVEETQVSYVILIDDSIDDSEVLETVKRDTARVMFQLFPVMRIHASRPDDVWQNFAIPIDRRRS